MPTDTNKTTTKDFIAKYLAYDYIDMTFAPGGIKRFDRLRKRANAELETIIAVRELDARIDILKMVNSTVKPGEACCSTHHDVVNHLTDLQKQKQALLEQQG